MCWYKSMHTWPLVLHFQAFCLIKDYSNFMVYSICYNNSGLPAQMLPNRSIGTSKMCGAGTEVAQFPICLLKLHWLRFKHKIVGLHIVDINRGSKVAQFHYFVEVWATLQHLLKHKCKLCLLLIFFSPCGQLCVHLPTVHLDILNELYISLSSKLFSQNGSRSLDSLSFKWATWIWKSIQWNDS